MSDIEREQAKEQLRAMVAGRGDGIDLDTPFHWVIEGAIQPVSFFEHLPKLLPADSVLYVEGTNIAPELARFYSAHHAHNALAVARDTIMPAPDIYHLAFSSDVSARLRQFAEGRPVAEMFDHIKAYQDGHLLFTFHDAFSGWLRISERLPEEVITRFCQTLGVSRRREETKQRDPEQLRRMLAAFEQPGEVRSEPEEESWIKRLWKRWTMK